MFIRKHILRNAAGDDGSPGGGGGGSVTITPELQAIIDTKVGEAVTGLKTKNGELIGKLKAVGDDLKRFEGIDPDAVRTILSKFADDEEAGLIKSGKIDEVLNKRTERMQAENQKALKAEQEKYERAESKASKLAERTLSAAIKDAGLKSGAYPEALEDIVLRGKHLWRLSDDGEPVAMNGDEIVLGKDGKTPLSPMEWAESLREAAPHLWPKAQGSNAPGSNGDKGAPKKGKAPERKDYADDISYTKAAARYHAAAD
jgi:hypothetical protein